MKTLSRIYTALVFMFLYAPIAVLLLVLRKSLAVSRFGKFQNI